MTELTVLELCTGGGGQALGLERAGFTPLSLVEIDADCCDTLHLNRPAWPVLQGDITRLPGLVHSIEGRIHLVAAGLPCTPHTRGGRQLGRDDARHLWSAALSVIAEARPRAVMIETADAILSPRFEDERRGTLAALCALGYLVPAWREIDASDYGVPQRRKRAVLVAFLSARAALRDFTWPAPDPEPPPTVGDALYQLARAEGWFPGAVHWATQAQDLAPTVTGGSTKHGGPDLGASQGKAAWRRLGIDPMGIADGPPGPDGKYPRGRGLTGDAGETGLMLTIEMAARLQGFPPDWAFSGGKTARYRQVGNAFPPPAARAIGSAIHTALTRESN